MLVLLDRIMLNKKIAKWRIKKYRKKSYVVTAEKVPARTKLNNFLEGRYYKTSEENCIKIIGTAGEMWPITIEELCKTYTMENGTPITGDNIPSGKFRVRTIVGDYEETVFAVQTKSRIFVKTKNGEIFVSNRIGTSHGNGDFIVYSNNNGKPNFNDAIVVNGKIFLNMYEDVIEK